MSEIKQPALRFSGENFQSWEEFTLDIDGLTVVVGPSSTGKSAIFRALRALFRNELGEQYLRHGQKVMTLSATVLGHTITATRKLNGSTSYVIDGEPYAKLGKGGLPEPLEKLNFGKVEMGGVKLDPIFADQFGSQFMLSLGPTEITSVLSGFASTDRLERGKRAILAEIADFNAQAKNLAVQIHKAQTEKARLAPLAERAREIEAAIAALHPLVDERQRVVDTLGLLTPTQEQMEYTHSLLSRIHIPDLAEASRLQRVLAAATSAIEATERHDHIVGLLDRITVPDIAMATSALRRLEWTTRAVAAQSEFEAATRVVENFDATTERWSMTVAAYKRTKAIQDTLVAQAEVSEERLDLLRKLAHRLDLLAVHEEEAELAQQRIAELDRLMATQAEEAHLLAEVAAMDTSLEALGAEVEAIREDMREAERKAAMVECPDCGTTFIPNEKHQHEEVF